MKKAITTFLALALVALPVAAQKVYKWVDKDGNVHFGDSIPPEYAEQASGNASADSAAGSASSDQAAAASADVNEEIRRRKEAAHQQESDRVLLQTYLSVEEIEAVRDNRIGQLQSQDQLTQRYKETLERHLIDLETESQPTGTDGQEGTDVKLASEIADTRANIRVYEDELARSQAEQDRMREKFTQDITRFRELKGLPPEG